MSAIAIITARGGSKRIPKKNIKDFCGKPIIAYSIEAALKSGKFDEVMVSTDSEEIAKIAGSYGAKVPFLRSEATSDDYATTADVIDEVISEYEKRNMFFDTFCCIYPTAPFVTAKKIAEAVEMLNNSDADSVVSVTKFSFPPQRAFVVREGKVRLQFPENKLKRSQDLEPIYHDCGQFYVCRTDKFREWHFLVTDNTLPYIISQEEVQDIDDISDWLIAEAKFRVLNGK